MKNRTLGYGGHAQEILPRLLPGGRLIGLDADPIELPRTEARLRALGFGTDVFSVQRSNFAGLAKALANERLGGADMVLADLGVSSMQIDDPKRGFSFKASGPLDLRMNPQRGEPCSALLAKLAPNALAALLIENADEPRAHEIAAEIAGRSFASSSALAAALRERGDEDTVRRVFQALRIAVNDEFGALDALLRQLPACLNPGGRALFLTFHSGEDRRVKKAFAAGQHDGIYREVSREVTRATPEERHANPRSTSAKLRWAVRA